MQYNSMIVNESYNQKECGIDVVSMKTGAFVLRPSDFERLMNCLNLSMVLELRKSKNDTIILPSHPLQQKDNHEIHI